MKIIIAQIIGIIAIILNILSLQYKKKKKVMNMQLIANALFSLQYLVLGAFSGAYMNVITVIRCLLYKKYNSSRKKVPTYLVIFVITLCLIAGYVGYNGLFSLIPTIITIIYCIAATSKNVKKYKLIYGLCAIVWLYYNFKVKALVNMIGNIFEIASAIISLKKKK